MPCPLNLVYYLNTPKPPYVLSHQEVNYLSCLSHLFTLYLDFWKYFLFYIVITTDNNITVIMQLITISSSILMTLERDREKNKIPINSRKGEIRFGYIGLLFDFLVADNCRHISQNNTAMDIFLAAMGEMIIH